MKQRFSRLGALLAGAVLLFSTAGGLFGMGGQEEEPVRVAVSTSWVAALAYAAGAEEVHVLAPYEMKHPPEYELRPSDLTAVAEAEVIIYAGYETMVAKLKEVAENQSVRMVQVRTDNDPENLEAAITSIGEALGTAGEAKAEAGRIRQFYADWRRELKDAGFYGARIAVHRFQKDVAESLGFQVVETFGPAPLEAPAIAEISEAAVRLVIDNEHNPVAEPLKKTLGGGGSGGGAAVPVVALSNFPQDDKAPEIWSVLKENRTRLTAALGQDAESQDAESQDAGSQD